MAKKDTNVPVEQCENMDMELLRRQMKRLEEALTAMKEEMSKMASPSQLPALIPSEPTPIELPEINIPDNLATSEDIKTMSDTIVKLNESLTLVVKGMAELKTAFENMPKPEDKTEEIVNKASVAFAAKLTTDLKPSIEKGHKESYYNGRNQYDGISIKDAADIYRQIGDLRTDADLKGKLAKRDKAIRVMAIVILGLVDIIVGVGFWLHSVKRENHELINVEWLYRAQRAISKDAKFLDMIEKDMLGKDESEKEEWKGLIVERESSGPEFNFFQPHDDWKPKPPKEEKPKEAVERKTKVVATKDTIDYTLMPHKNPKRFTPGEIENIKKMRANPHIPDDAKPPLPKGYE